MMKWARVVMIILGLSLASPHVQAEESGLEYFPTSEGTMADDRSMGEEAAIEEGSEDDGVTDRGIRRFKRKPTLKRQFQRRPAIKKAPRFFRPKKPSTKQPPPGIPPGSPPTQPPPTPQCVWKTSDIIDMRIEISAQQSLMRMMSQGGVEERRAASAMIGAIKNGTLAGIHAPFLGRKASVDRAASIPPPGTRGYWTLLQPGQVGMCLQEPVGAPPMLLYREKNQHSSVIDNTLRTRWAECGLPTPGQPCSYLVNLHKPPPPPEPGTPEDPSGIGTLIIQVSGNGQAVRGATVFGADQSGQHGINGVTGSGGQVSFTTPAGNYKLFISKKGFSLSYQEIPIAAGTTFLLDTTLNAVPK